jgi:hypothetical protein
MKDIEAVEAVIAESKIKTLKAEFRELHRRLGRTT